MFSLTTEEQSDRASRHAIRQSRVSTIVYQDGKFGIIIVQHKALTRSFKVYYTTYTYPAFLLVM